MFSVILVTKLRKELELNELKKKTESCSVDTALMALQALVGRPPVLFDSYAATAALEEVVHLAQKYTDERYSRYQIILRKCHPLVTAGRTRGPSYGYRRGRGSRRCWNCGQLDHLQRACSKAEASKRQ